MLGNLADLLKAVADISARPLIAIAFGTGILILGKAEWLAKFGITNLLVEYRFWIGLAFLGSCCFLAAHVIHFVAFIIGDWWTSRLLVRQRREMLERLTPEEKGYLQVYVAGAVASIPFPVEDGIAAGLRAKRIVYRTSSVGRHFTFPHGLQDWARAMLLENPALLADAKMPKPRESRF